MVFGQQNRFVLFQEVQDFSTKPCKMRSDSTFHFMKRSEFSHQWPKVMMVVMMDGARFAKVCDATGRSHDLAVPAYISLPAR